MPVTLADREILTLTMSEHLLTPALRLRLGRAKPSSNAPQTRSKGMGSMRFSLNGVLGRAALTMEDLERLGVGDVIVLDRELDEAVEIRLAGPDTIIARGKLIRSGAQLCIQL